MSIGWILWASLTCRHSCPDFRTILARPGLEFHNIPGSDYHSNFRHRFFLNYTVPSSPGVIITGLTKVSHVPFPGKEEIVLGRGGLKANNLLLNKWERNCKQYLNSHSFGSHSSYRTTHKCKRICKICSLAGWPSAQPFSLTERSGNVFGGSTSRPMLSPPIFLEFVSTFLHVWDLMH